MNKIIFPLKQNTQGVAVVDLHDALRLCLDRGALLANNDALRQELLAALIPERNAQTYGRATGRLVSTFQGERRLQSSGEVDEPTANALNALLADWGLLDQPTEPVPPQSLLVQGAVRNPDGSAVSRITVKAFDRNLRGETLIGEAPTDVDGSYEIRYVTARLQPPGKTVADLMVRAYDARGNEVAHSDFICHAPAETTVDLVVDNVPLRGATEYDQLVKAIKPYLGETKLADLERDDVAFLSCSAEVDRVQVATLVVGSRLSGDTGLPDWSFYALGRQGVQLDLTSMLALTATRLKESLDRAIAANIVAPVEEQTETALLDQLHAALLKEAFREDIAPGTFSVGALLDASLVDRALQQEFLSRYVRHEGTLEDFWKSLEEDPRFTAAVVEDLRFTLILGRLTGYLIPALQQLKGLRQRQELAKLTDLAKLTRPRWREMLGNAAGSGELDLPEDITGAIYTDRVENYISAIRIAIETMLPGESLRVALQAAPETGQTLRRLLQNADSLDLYWDNTDTKLTERGEAAFEGIAEPERDSVVQHAKALQRLVRLSPHSDHVRILQAAGFHSAYSIARTPKRRFNKLFAKSAQDLWESLDGAYTIEAPNETVEEDS